MYDGATVNVACAAFVLTSTNRNRTYCYIVLTESQYKYAQPKNVIRYITIAPHTPLFYGSKELGKEGGFRCTVDSVHHVDEYDLAK